MSVLHDLVWIEAGEFSMGSDAHYPEEAPVHRVRVSGFWIDRYPVTNSQFARFVDTTSYTTVAEGHGGAPAGSAIFRMPEGPVSLDDPSVWWTFGVGVDWRHPRGLGSDLAGLEDHPVVHVSYRDAMAYASWAGLSLPSEAQSEFAARGGLDEGAFPWGDTSAREPGVLANVWEGEFPWRSTRSGSPGTTAVGSYPPNGYGLADVVGNVWEWTSTRYRPGHGFYALGLGIGQGSSCCPVIDPTGPRLGMVDSYAPWAALHALKGGSFLCSEAYCFRYRPAARIPQAVDSAACNVGFRCVANDRR